MADNPNPKQDLTLVKGGVAGLVFIASQMSKMMVDLNEFTKDSYQKFNSLLDQLRETAESTEKALPEVEDNR